MIEQIKVKVGPQFYLYNESAIDFIPKILDEHQAARILIVHGTISWEKAKLFMTFLDDEKYSFFYHQYTGECSYFGTDLISSKIKDYGIDFIIGVGGGKLTDLVGYAASVNNKNFGVIPTLASNCAPWTPLSVMYKENGDSEGKTEHFLRQAAFLITDPKLVIDSPVEYFIAGLADTLAKWYESESIITQDFLQNEPFIKMAAYSAFLCKDGIEKEAKKAIDDMSKGNISPEFIYWSEIIFAVAGTVGGLGDKYARNAAAHAMHDAMSKYLPDSHKYLHGEKVAYGIFYQMAVEGRWSTIDDLLPLYKELKLPNSLESMGIFPKDKEALENIVNFIDSKEKVHLIPCDTSKKILEESIYKLEEYMKNKGL